MGTSPIDYQAVLADLENRKAQIDSAIEAVKLILGQGSSPSPVGGGSTTSDFLGMSIPEAAKKHLASVRSKQSTQDIMTALEAGGLPQSKYSTVYAVLRRREQQVGDIVNMKGDWGLAEWYPNYRAKNKSSKEDASEKALEESEKSLEEMVDLAEKAKPSKAS